MKVLLSIKPEFVEKIISGEKKFEYRRLIFKKDVKSVIIYASSSWKAVIGEFFVEDILTEDLDILWNLTKKYSGIDEEFFWKYFQGKEKGHAIKIGKLILYQKKLDLKKDFGILPPQSYVYI